MCNDMFQQLPEDLWILFSILELGEGYLLKVLLFVLLLPKWVTDILSCSCTSLVSLNSCFTIYLISVLDYPTENSLDEIIVDRTLLSYHL